MLRSSRVALCLVPALLSIASVAHAQDEDPPPLPPATATAPPPGYGQPPPPGYGQPPPPGYGQPPPGYYPPPGYGQPYYQPQGDQRPLKLEYDEGQPIPQGYHLRSSVRKGLIGGGAGLMGGLWLISIITGAIGNAGNSLAGSQEKWTPMYVPVVGPFITIGTAESDLSTGGAALLAFDGVGQLGGLAMLILGIVVKKKELVRDPVAFQLSPDVSITPVFTGKGGGLVGTF